MSEININEMIDEILENQDGPKAEPPQEKSEDPKPQENQPAQAAPPRSLIELDDKGRVLAKNNSELLRYAGALVASEMVPKWFDKPGKLFGALVFVRSLGLPDMAIRQVASIHGVPSLFGDLPLALVQMSKELTFFKEQWFDKDYKIICFEEKNLNSEVYGAVCFLKRGDGEQQSFAFTMDDAKQAKLYPDSNASKPWMKYTKLMLRYRARSIGLKSLFADKLNGAAIMEYDFNTNDPLERDVSNEKTLANELNNLGGAETSGLNS